MKALKHVLALAFVAALVTLGCSDDEEKGAAIGELCSGSISCVEGARCDSRGFCTKACATHADCGCADGTTDGDVAASACRVACVSGSCVKACRTDTDCAGTTQCLSNAAFDTCE